MILYTKNNEVKEYSTDNQIGCGSFGKVYLIEDDKCLKLFNAPIAREDNYELQEDIYYEIRELKLKNFYELYDLYYNSFLTKILGYLSKYYEKEDIDILTMPTDYTIDNLNSLYESFKKLSEHNICTNDISSSNVIINRDSITMIDIDLYYRNYFGIGKSTFSENLCNLEKIFKEVYILSLTFYPLKERIKMIDKIDKLFFLDETIGIDYVAKKLTKYKYPIDYLRKR